MYCCYPIPKKIRESYTLPKMKKPLLILLALAVLAISIIALLVVNSTRGDEISHGFTRKFDQKRNVQLIKEYLLEKPVFSIAGVDNDQLLLTTAVPGETIKVGLTDGKTENERIYIDEAEKFATAFHTAVLYPDIFITGTNNRKIVRGNLQTGSKETFVTATGPILSTQIIDRENVIIRFIDTPSLQPYLTKFNLSEGLLSDNYIPVALTIDSNNLFYYNGLLNYDSESRKAAFVNFYCNEMIIFDKEIQHVERMHTIDTMYSPKVPAINSGEVITGRQPPVITNRTSCYYNGTLYINSALRSDNENVKEFKEQSVIDVYGEHYEGSFYLPVDPGTILQIKMLSNNEMIILTKEDIKLFRLL